MGTRIRTHIKPKMRIISFVLAFVMVFVGLPYVGVNAAEGDITLQEAISATTTQTSIVSGKNGQTASLSGQTDSTGSATYTYNGNIKTTNVELFDYFSDSEVGGGGPSQGWDGGYSNPYNNFNMQVSCSDGSSTSYSGNNNITIKLKKGTKIGSTTYSSAPHIYVWNGSSNNGYPGPQMKYDSNDDSFTYTFNRSDASCSEYISFNPANLQFNDGSSGTDLTQSMTAGNTYFFQNKTVIDVSISANTTGWNIRAKLKDVNGTEHMENMQWHHSSSNGTKQHFQLVTAVEDLSYTPKYVNIYGCNPNHGSPYYDYDHQSSQATLTIGKINYLYFDGSNDELGNSLVDPDGVSCKTTPSAETIYTGSCLYENPLYFGAFFMSNNENGYTTTNKPGTSGGKYGGPYNNFYWQSHISLKGNTNGYSETRGRAALQGLVDNNLTGGVASGDLQQGGNVLPYFSESWAGTHSNVMTYYNKDDTALSKSISFPFYEVTIGATEGIGYQAGEHSATDSVAKYYQFNSELNNLYFEKGSASNSGHFVETSWGDHIKGDEQGSGNSTNNGNKKEGFFPFNTNSNQNKNYGFGARFDMDFHLNEDGKIAVYDSNDKQQSRAGRVNTRFEFKGDDDLWVFIDGHLVLDLGGVHDATDGYIDFTERKAVANYAITLGDGNSKDTLYYDVNDNTHTQVVTPGPLTIEDTFTRDGDNNITDWAAGGNAFSSLINGNNTATTYDTNEPHTLTVFYMERGMFDSNLLIRFNFPIEPNFNKLKIREDTDFSGINKGLRELTMQAAENDVFKYTVTNKGTKSADVIDGTAPYPTKVDNTRNGLKLTSTTTPYYGTNTESKTINFNPADTTTEYPMANVSYNWVDGFVPDEGMSSNNHVAGITNGSGELFLMFGTSSVKSSAEFEGQLSRYSTMRVTQISGNDMLYKPKTNGNNAITFEESDRKYSDYYSLSTPYIFTKKSKTAGYTGTNVTNGNMNVTNGGTYTVRSDIGSSNVKDADETKEVQMTEYFINVPNKGGITIKKLLPSGETVVPSDKTTFTIKVRFEDIFGVSGVNADNASQYEAIKYTVYDSKGAVTGKTNIPMGSSTMTVSGETKVCGTVTVGVNQWAVIDEIPYNTKYIIDEDEPYYAKPTVTNNNRTVITGTIDNSSHLATQSNNNAEVTNFSHTLTVKEVTDFSGVNTGLVSYTKTAAEKDVFKYTVSNSGTLDGDVVDSGVKTPTYDEYKRGNVTLTKQQPIQYGYVYDYDSIFLDVKIDDSNYWDSGDSVIAATFQDNTTPNAVNTDFIIGEKIEGTTVYKFTGYSDDAVKVRFFRLYASQAPFVTETNLWLGDAKIRHKAASTLIFNGGDLFKITGWGGTDKKSPCQKDDYNSPYPVDKSVIYNAPHNYTPSVSNTIVSNTNYEWKDQYAGRVGEGPYDTIDGMTGTTGNDGEFYLMHGTTAYAENSVTYTQDKESSATFYNQFARNSTMTVEQDGTLTSPNGGTPDTLKANNQRGASTSLATYYTTTKALTGSTSSAPDSNDSFAFNNSNSNQSIHITETFTNSINKGTLKISKEIDPTETTNDTQTNAEFTFKITLTNVLGVTDNNVGRTDYDDIEVLKSGIAHPSSYRMTLPTDTSDNSGIFTLKVGQTLTIPDIPVGTSYQIEELENNDSATAGYYYTVNKTYKKNASNQWVDRNSTTISGTIETNGEVNEFKVTNKRKTATLTLSKSLYAYDGAAGDNNTTYSFKVDLEPPTGVTLETLDITNYPITCTNSDTTTVNYNYTNHTVTVTAKKDTSATISGIPYGTGYTVTEVDPTGSPVVEYNGSILDKLTGTITGDTNATITNTYRKITMTKVDAVNNSLGVQGATYYLLRLKDGITASTAGAKTEFEGTNTTHSTFASSSYFEVCGGSFTTGSGGTVEVNDANVTNGLKPGSYIFFEESAPDDYEKDNSYTSDKIITISGYTTLEYTKTNHEYTDTRKKGELTLSKSVDAGTGTILPTGATSQEFTYSITLTHTDSNVKLNQYGITCNDQDNQPITGTYTEATNTYTFTAKVHNNDTDLVTFRNLPYGTRYSVSETSSLPTCIVQSNDPATGGIGAEDNATNTAPTKNASITNTYETGSLTISKTLAGNTNNYNYDTNKDFIFTVTLTPETSDFVNLSNYTITDSSTPTKIYSISADHKTIQLRLKHNQSTTIGNIPLGTKFTVAETNPNDSSSVKYQITGDSEVSGQYSTPSGNSNTKITSTAKTVAFTNTYPNTVSLTLGKRTTGTKPSNAPTDYTFKVYFSSTIGFSGYTIKKAVGSAAATDITTDFNTNHNPYVLTINASTSSENDVVISGLPTDTEYRVVEDDASETGTVKPNSSTPKVEGEMDSAVAVSTQSSHTITNHYPDVYTLKLKKLVAGELPKSMGISPTFKFRVTLATQSGVTLLNSSSPSGTVGYQITQTPNGGSASNVDTPSSFVVELQAGNESDDTNTVTIGNIPAGTVYTVTEESTYKKSGVSPDPTLPSFTQKSGEVKVVTEPSNEAARTINANKSATITNTYPTLGSLTLSKSLVDAGNTATNHNGILGTTKVEDSTPFIFKVQLTNDTVDLREYMTALDSGSIIGPDSSQELGENEYIVYVLVRESDTTNNTLKIIQNIPNGTTYEVTEWYRYNKTTSSWEYITSDPNNPHVKYGDGSDPSKATGTITGSTVANATVTNAEITNTYRQITITKKDVKQDNSADKVLSGASYVLLKLKSTTNVSDSAVQTAFAGATVDNIAAYYTSTLATYCDGHSSVLTTNASGQIVVHDSDITGGITDGNYFFLELSPPANYEKDNAATCTPVGGTGAALNKVIMVVNGINNYDSIVYTDTRKTGKLTLSKTNAGTYKPSDAAGKTYTYKIKLTKPSDLTDFTGYTITKKVGNGNAESYTPVSGWDTVTVSESNPVVFDGLPYGTEYEVYEDETLPAYITTETDGSTEAKRIKGTVNDSNNSGAAVANITNTYLTGQLTLTKTTSGANAPTAATTFTFTGKFKRTDDVNLDTYTFSSEGSPSGVNVTFTKNTYNTTSKECTFTATVEVPANANTASVFIKGIPYGTQYIDVMEDEIESLLPAGVTVNVTGGTGTSVSDKKASGTINSTNATHTVTVDNSYPASGNLTITKQVVGTLPASVGNSFTIKYILTAPGGGDFSGYTITRKVGNGTEDSFEPQSDTEYSSTISDGQSIVIKGLPDNTTYTITETRTVPSGVSWTTSLNSTPITDKTFNASTGASETITNTFPYTGTLTLSKELSGESNANSGNVTGETGFTFKVTLKEPSGISFLGNYMTSEITSSTPNTEDESTHQKTYTIYKTVKQSNTGDTAVKIEGIPNGTVYTVTEVQSDHSDISGDPNKQSVTYSNTASGTITATGSNVSVVATVTNTYRKVTLTKKDSNDNHVLNGAVYVLVRLKEKDGTNNTIDYTSSTVTDLFSGATALSDITAYIDGQSSELTTGTNGEASDDGKVVVKSSQMGGGLIPGKYFFFEKTAPANYTQDNSITGKIFTIADNTTTVNYDNIVHTNNRKTGSLKLKKTVSGTAPSDAPADYTFKVKLTKPSDLTDFSNYTIQKDSTSISVTSGTEFSVQVPANGTEVILSNIPYGTTYEVYEDTTGFAYNLKSDHDSTSKLTGTVGETGTNYADPAIAKITNTYQTGTLELVKVIENGYTDTSTAFTYHVTLTNSKTGIDLTKYMTQTPTTGTGATIANAAESVTIENINYTAGRIGFDVKIVSGTDVSISGLPYGTDYSVSEDDKEGWSKKPSSAVTDYSGTITSDTADTVTKTATFTNAKTGTLAFDENLVGDWEQQNFYTQDSEFIFTVTLAPASGISIDLSDYASGIKLNGAAAELGNYSEGYIFTVTVKSSDLLSANKITGIPYGTAYSVISTDPTPTNSTMGEGWTRTPTTDLSGNINLTHPDGEIIVNDSYTVSTPPTPVTASLTITKTDTNGTAITSSPATYYLLKLNSDFDTAYVDDPAALSNTFKNAASPSDLSQYYSGCYGPKQTDSNGRVVFTDSDLTIATGDKYFFFEAQAPYGYAIDNSLTYVDSSGNTHSKILTITESDKTPTAAYPDPNTTGVSVYKTNEYGEGLENGEFDLYYKQNNTTTPPPTYSYNKPETSPVPEATTKINRNDLTVPEDAAGTSSVTTYTYEYSYPSEPSTPSSAEEDWILPRSDNDYIYFRDYNTGTINNKDTDAFYYQDHNNDQKRYWINTWLNNNEFGQNEEIGYDHRYKIKAQFTKNGSDLKEYEAWERFVDEYTDTANNSSNATRKTVIWKIQPPDGYNKVRFCLYDGGQCIRTTQEFSFVLGNIYTKTGQGDGTDHKWNYPVKGEHWSTNWNGTGAGQSDKRMNYSSIYQSSGTGWKNTTNYVYNNQSTTSSQQAPEQTQRYTATEQKIVFQCNSKQVWHNIHIEFFSSAAENDRIGHGFPGYMMEPYAFAGNDYRMKGYLTYELTIPKGATHFRINNGVPSGNFAYKTPITQLRTDTSKNNYGNFFKFDNTPQNKPFDSATLRQWTKQEIQNAGDKYYATYNTADVESDYDYIYFRLPSGSGWSSHVYAYFYGGGDLRAHNWQRGVYSIWPGVAPVATEYSVSNGGTDTAQHSDHYTYEYTGTLFAENPSSTGNLTGINPESTFQYDGGTVYKFKIPKSERVTYENNGKRVYDKVIFNDGFKKYSANTSTSSNNETGMIGFQAGYIYSPDDTTGKKYYGDATSNYTGRGDYLYINNAANWDNLHVTFYNASGTAIWQGGTGYIMQYEGTNASGKYYRIPIPSGAAKFKLNNGKSSGLESTSMGVIYPKQNAVDTSKKDYTTGDMIYTLNANKSLTKDYPNFTAPTQVPHTSSSSTLQASDVDYVTRGDKLYIRNTAEWSGMNIGAVKVKFYDSSNAVIGTTGTYTMIVSETETVSVASDNRTNGAGSNSATKWYSIDIPMNAAKFQLTSPVSTAQYDIYELINSDGSTERNYKWTKGGMYYETSGTNALTLLYPTYYQSVDYTATDNYGTGNARGDNLYLVVSDLDKWENMRVTFYNASGEAIKNTANDTAIVPNYIGHRDSSATNEEAVGYWFKIAIPKNAVSFKATSSSRNSDSGDIYELSQNRTYHFRNDYTPGDMQYRITDTLSGGTYNLSLMYPIFTEEPFYSLNDEVNNSYPTNNITIPTPTSGTNDAPILYETTADTITYNWTEGSIKLYYKNSKGWNDVYAHFWKNGGTSAQDDGGLHPMTSEGNNVYSIDIPDYADRVIFAKNASWEEQTSSLELPSDVNTTTYIYKGVTTTGTRTCLYFSPQDVTNNRIAYFYNDSNQQIAYASNQNPSGLMNEGGGSGPNNKNSYKATIPTGATKVKFGASNGNATNLDDYTWTSVLPFSSIESGKGVMMTGSSGTGTVTYYDLSTYGLNDGSSVTEWDFHLYTNSSSTVPVQATYQPEDRYGMISNLNSGTTPVTSGFTDDGNFIKVVLASGTTITKPYIKFYASDSTTVIGGRAISLTARLNGSTSDANAGVTQPGDGSSNNPYKIRLPKNAKSVELYDDSTKIGDTISLTNDGGATLTVSGTGDSRTVSKTSTTKNSTALQSGVTADEGFIFYKGNMTRAYYYGGVDGEFCAWPGVPYSYSYTDGSDTVYAFQIPTTSNSTSKVYPYVIFNDGTNNSGTNMTVAVDYTGKEIYQDSNASGAYGSWSAAPKTVTHTTKTTPTPQGDPDDTPPEYTEIHLATIVTGADGKQKYIKWLKPKPGAEDEVDTEYLDHVFSDIGKDANKTEVRVKKLGEYYWVETVAPAGYKAVKDKIEFTLTQADTAAGSYITHIVDEPLPGKVLLMKTAKEKVGNTDIGDPLPGAGFNLTTRAVQTTFISVAKKTNKSEYYVIPTDDEEYVALSRSGEYDTEGTTVDKIVPDPDNEGQTKTVTVNKLKEYMELVTDENGYIKIENLVWGDYVLTETNNTPSGYAGSLSKVYFTVGKNNSDITQEVFMKDAMNPAYIKLFEHINERRNAWGNPTFTFKIKQTQNYILEYDDTNDVWVRTLTDIPTDEQKELLVSLTVNDDGTLNSNILKSEFDNWLVESTDEVKDTLREYQGMYHIDSQGRIRVEPGSYEITRMPISRYEFVTSAYTNQYDNGGTAGVQNENLDNSRKPLEKVTISGLEAGKTIDVHYYDKVGYYDKFSQVDTKVNKFYTLNSKKENATVKGIRIDDYYVADSGTVSGNTLTISTNDVTNFKAYKIMADGTEQQITGVDLAKLDISYNYESGSKDDEQFDTDFSYSNLTLTVNNASRYHDSVYKLNVSYTDDTFTTTAAFNLVFEKQSTNVTYYTAQVIFKNDSQDTTSHDQSNISYFEEDNNRTHAYEFTFVIADDNGTKTVSDIRHNGTSVGIGAAAWKNALSTMEGKFKILDNYIYIFNSWVQLAPSSPSLTDYNSIVGYITGLTPTDGKVDSIEFAAHLTSS